MYYLLHLLVLANCMFVINGTPKDPVRYLRDNPVPALERYFSRSLYQTTILSAPPVQYSYRDACLQRLALQNERGNLLVSPLCVDVLLATLLEGAQGDDRVHLTRILGLDQIIGFPYSDVKIGYLQLLKNITSILQMSTRIYQSRDVVVNEEFLSIAQDYYQTGVETLNLTNKEEAAKTINNYVGDNTNHTITQVVSEGDFSENSTMVCISTAHFQNQWNFLFPKQITSKQQFRSSPQTQSLVNMMRVKNKFHYVWNATLRARLLALDFITKNVSMIFMLPDEEDKLFDLETRLGSIDVIPLLRLIQSTPPVNVDLWMPRFHLQEHLDLGQTLQQMGLASLFTPEADLSGISSRVGLHISKMKQKSHLVVGENGVEASSTEVVEVEKGTEEDDWQEFHADHPFLFFLVMDELVVFQGRLVKP